MALLAVIIVGIAVGCSTPAKQAAAPAPDAKPAVVGAGGAQLWAQNCGHCHNIRSPSMYSDAQWDIAMLHMRVRGNLTATEHKEILAFLKTAH